MNVKTFARNTSLGRKDLVAPSISSSSSGHHSSCSSSGNSC